MNQDPERIHDAYAPVHILPRPQCAVHGGAQDIDGLVAALPRGSWEPGAPCPCCGSTPERARLAAGTGPYPNGHAEYCRSCHGWLTC
jgi:hypothetical protein